MKKENLKIAINAIDAIVEDVKEFVKNKDYVIAKELDNCGGKGIDKVKIDNNIKEIYDKLKSNKQYLVEEIIKQNQRYQLMNL